MPTIAPSLLNAQVEPFCNTSDVVVEVELRKCLTSFHADFKCC